MIFIPVLVVCCALAKIAAPYAKTVVAGRELARPGMNFMQVAIKPTPIDGVWAPDELPAVLTALRGGDQKILAIGQERVEALIKAGCPHCKGCKKIFPTAVPAACDRCGHGL